MKFLLGFLLLFATAEAGVELGVDRFFDGDYVEQVQGKRVGLITNHTGVDGQLRSTIKRFKEDPRIRLVALFGPEHGITGAEHAGIHVEDARDRDGVPIYSLHGKTRRPTDEMLQGIDVLVFDIQDVGARHYTYVSTLCYAMEEAAKRKIQVIVLDRPNPINGMVVDGPLVDPKFRSFVSYLNVPVCHGMTIGELARFFNIEYSVGCDLVVVPMKGWKREMSWCDTGLTWVPTSPHIPEVDTPLYYPATGLLGEGIEGLSVGVGYTLPFKIVGAPWIDGDRLAAALNKQNFAGVHFQSFRFRPFFGRHVGEDCQGVRIVVTDHLEYKPVSTQFLMLGVIKSLYPKEFAHGLGGHSELFHKLTGTDRVAQIVRDEKYVAWKLIAIDEEERAAFCQRRKPYLLY